MRGIRASGPVTAIVALLLIVALVPLVGAFGHWNAWRLAPDDRGYVERALRTGSREFGATPEDYRRLTRPTVNKRADEICVILATSHSYGDGSYSACYDRRSGHVIEERVSGPTFGNARPSDQLRALIW